MAINESERKRIRCLRFLMGTLIVTGLTFGYTFVNTSSTSNFIRPFVGSAAMGALAMLPIFIKRKW